MRTLVASDPIDPVEALEALLLVHTVDDVTTLPGWNWKEQVAAAIGGVRDQRNRLTALEQQVAALEKEVAANHSLEFIGVL